MEKGSHYLMLVAERTIERNEQTDNLFCTTKAHIYFGGIRLLLTSFRGVIVIPKIITGLGGRDESKA
jgi:hypothetical protein